MKKLLILLFLTFYAYAQTLTKIEFTGDVDLITGEFDRATLLKVCHIEYPSIYKIWKEDPTFERSQVQGFVENLKQYTQSMGYYKAKVSSKIEDETIYLNIQKNAP
ncbi:MAG TPA: hypothetical protein ENK66_08565, partial [Arcobacter sp.]|nr:hypothetical protein [Arcobacter sp.]